MEPNPSTSDLDQVSSNFERQMGEKPQALKDPPQTFVPEHEGQYFEAVERMYISRIDELMRENGMLKLAVATLQGTVAVLEGRAEPRPIYLYRPCSDCPKMEFMRTTLICCAVVISLLVGNQIIEALLP